MTTQAAALERRRAKCSPMNGLSRFIMVDGKTRIDKADKISALPESLLQHIMSFLPFKDAVRTSVLSKTWEKAWSTFPVLEFDEDLFERDLLEMSSAHRDDKKYNQIRGKLLNYWGKVLQTRHRNKISVHKFILKMRLLSDTELSDRCICYAVESNVKELKLEMKPDISLQSRLLYNLPHVVLCSKSLNVLELEGCKLELPRSNVIELFSLRKLNLFHVNVDDQVVENLIAGCPMIEDLSFQSCQGFKRIKLFGLSKLSKIKVTDNRELEEMNVSALNTRSITVQGPTVPSAINIVLCKNLKFLSLYAASVVDEWLSYLISRLPVLEVLGISRCYKLESIEISSPCLKGLKIIGCKKLAAVKIETPNLRKFGYNGDIISFSSSALTLLETNLYLYSGNIDSQWYVKYIELIARFRRSSKVLILRCDRGENVIFPKELRQTLPPPLSGVKHLNFVIYVSHLSFPIAQVMDGLLWMSPHVDTVSLEYGSHFKKLFFQILYKEDILCGGETTLCCKSVPVLCWGHCIKKIEVEMISEELDSTDRPVISQTKKFVFEGEEILLKVAGLGDLILA